ncbi:IS1595 family transposase, partial [Neisseria gonorrhoeae]
MSGVTKELDILKQLFENLSDTDKQAFLTSVSSKEQVKKVIEPRKVTKCPH